MNVSILPQSAKAFNNKYISSARPVIVIATESFASLLYHQTKWPLTHRWLQTQINLKNEKCGETTTWVSGLQPISTGYHVHALIYHMQ